MGEVHRIYIDPKSPEAIEGVREFLCSRQVFGASAQIKILRVEPRVWGITQVTDVLVVITIVSTRQIMLRVLYRVVRAEPLELSVWFDDSANYGHEISVPVIVAPIQDSPMNQPPLPFTRQ